MSQAATHPQPHLAKSKTFTKLQLGLVLFIMMAPTIVGMLIFGYYVKIDALLYAFYEWNNAGTEEFIWLNNFYEAWEDSAFWQSFNLVMILFASNLFKMWPSIVAAVALHRLRNAGARYIYQVLFVIPMVIPALVHLLVWKEGFFNPDVGLLNTFLNAIGGMWVLTQLDIAMPAMATSQLSPLVWMRTVLDPIFGNPFGVVIFGTMVLIAQPGLKVQRSRWIAWMFALLLGLWLVYTPIENNALLATGLLWLRIMGMAAVALLVGHLLFKEDHIIDPGQSPTKWIGNIIIGVGLTLVFLTMIWTTQIDAFQEGAPAWLGHEKLIIPSLIIWGFPWVGTVGVLLYLAALQAIPNDVYEAAELDGLGPIKTVWYIELPLILSMVRINLIFMTIGTLQQYGLQYILLGVNGGPGGVGMVPGLYMFKMGFQDLRYGYACALGMILFVLILALTLFYMKFVRVEK